MTYTVTNILGVWQVRTAAGVYVASFSTEAQALAHVALLGGRPASAFQRAGAAAANFGRMAGATIVGAGAALGSGLLAGAAGARRAFGSARAHAGAAFSGAAATARRAGNAAFTAAVRGFHDAVAGFGRASTAFSTAFATAVHAMIRGAGAAARGARRFGGAAAAMGTRAWAGARRFGGALGRGAARAFRGAGRFASALGRGASRVWAGFGRAGSAIGKGFSKALPILGPAVVGATGALTALIPAVRNFAENLISANRHLAQYNGQIAIAYARLSIGDFYRNMDLANRTAPSSEALVRAVDRMRDSFQEYRVLQGNLSNQFGTFTARFQEDLAKAFSPLASGLNHLLGKDESASIAETFADVLANAIPLVAFANALTAAIEWWNGGPLAKAGANPKQGDVDIFVQDIIAGRFRAGVLPHPPGLPLRGPFQQARP